MAEFLEFSSVGLFCLSWAQVSISFSPLNRILWVNSLCPDTRHWQCWHSCHGILCHGTLHCPSAASGFVQGFQAENCAGSWVATTGSLGAGPWEHSLPILPWTHMSPVTPSPSALGNFQVLPWRELRSRLGRAGRLGRFSMRNSLGCL